MSTTEASTPRPDHQQRAAVALAAIADWHARQHPITPAGLAALAMDPSTDRPRESTRRTRKAAA